MCTRYTLWKKEPLGAYEKILATAPEDWAPRYNVALTTRMPVVTWETKPVARDLAFGLALPARPPARQENVRSSSPTAAPTRCSRSRPFVTPCSIGAAWSRPMVFSNGKN